MATKPRRRDIWCLSLGIQRVLALRPVGVDVSVNFEFTGQIGRPEAGFCRRIDASNLEQQMRLVIWATLLALIPAQAILAQVKWVPLKPYPSSTKSKQPSKPTAKEAPTAIPVTTAQSNPPVVETAPSQAPASPIVTPAAGQPPLHLTCIGGGVASKATGASVWGYGGSATIIGKKDRGFADQVDVRLFNGDDRIRMPRTMLPGIRGGREGWFKLKDVVADARSIRASAAVNVINNPKVFIDRVTGTISISGKAGDYSGQCEVIDATAPAKF